MGKWRLASALVLACLLAVYGVVLAAEGDELTSQFRLTDADTEYSVAYSWATKDSRGRWTINYKFLNKARNGSQQGNPYGSTRFRWKSTGYDNYFDAGPNAYTWVDQMTSYRPLKEVTGTVTTNWGGSKSATHWVPDPGVAFQGGIGDSCAAWNDSFEYYDWIWYREYTGEVYRTTAVYNYMDQPMWAVLPTGDSGLIDPGDGYIVSGPISPSDWEAGLFETDGSLTIYYNYGTEDEQAVDRSVCYWLIS